MRTAICALLVCCMMQAAFTCAAGYEPVKSRVAPVQVGPNSYYIQGRAGIASVANEGFNANAGFVVTREGVVVIDALGTPSLGHEFIKAIRKVTAQPIKRVIVTHYHADHVYGLQAFKEIGAEIWAHQAGRDYLEGEAAERLAQRRRDLAPWVDAYTRVVAADRWLNVNEGFALGGINFDLIHMGPAHAPDDLVIVVREDQVIFSGDIIFAGRIPFVGQADSKRWLATMGRLLDLKPTTLVPGHGAVSRDPAADLKLSREYLLYLREVMGKAVEDFVPFEEAYLRTNWDRFRSVPAFEAANRINAYGTYLLMEKESLQK